MRAARAARDVLFGNLDRGATVGDPHTKGLAVAGTAQDPVPGSVEISVEVDGTQARRLTTSNGASARTVTPRASRDVCAWAINRNRRENALLDCRAPSISVNPVHHIDEVSGGPDSVGVHAWPWTRTRPPR